MADSFVQVAERDGAAIIKLTRPREMNALNVPLLLELSEAMQAMERGRARAIVLAGTEAAFSAGADIDSLSGHTAASYPTSDNARAFAAIRETQLPVVAAVSGYCLGGGCEIALGCDIVVSSDTAVFGQPEIRLGIIPGAGGTLMWADRAGRGAQAMAALLGDRVDAFAARRMGLVDRLVPVEAVEDEAVALARRLADGAPLANRAAKAAMRAPWRMPMHAALDHEVALMSRLLASSDAAEGLQAFLEKRAPRFEGR